MVDGRRGFGCSKSRALVCVCYCIVINIFRHTENSTASPPIQKNSAEIHSLLRGRIPHHLYKGIINGNSSANLTNGHRGGYRIPMSPDPLKQSKAGAYWCSKSILHYIYNLMNYNTPYISMIYLVFLHVSKSLKGSLFQPSIALFFDIQQKTTVGFFGSSTFTPSPGMRRKKRVKWDPKLLGS